MERYGIYFTTHARKAPHVKLYISEKQRDEDFNEVMVTKKIKFGHKAIEILQAGKCLIEEIFTNHELAKKQYLEEKVEA